MIVLVASNPLEFKLMSELMTEYFPCDPPAPPPPPPPPPPAVSLKSPPLSHFSFAALPRRLSPSPSLADPAVVAHPGHYHKFRRLDEG